MRAVPKIVDLALWIGAVAVLWSFWCLIDWHLDALRLAVDLWHW